MTKIKSIKDLGENEVVHCPTEKEAIAICQLMHDAGLKWSSGRSLLDYTNWAQYKDQTCYSYSSVVTYAELDFYIQEGKTIHPASSFLPESFYRVEPKVGQLWECVETFNYFNGGNGDGWDFTKDKLYEINEIAEDQRLWMRSDQDNNCAFLSDDSRFKHFKFHSNPSNMYPTEETTLNTKEEETKQLCDLEAVGIAESDEPISERKGIPPVQEAKIAAEKLVDSMRQSERKRESFRFYDQLPPELARQAKENFREDACKNVPTNLFEAIQYGWWWSESKHGNFSSWCRVRDNAQNGKYNLSEAHSSVMIDPMKHELIALYEKLDENGKKVMRESYPNVEFPKVKRYWNTIHAPFTYSHGILTCLDDVTPEIVGNEIRFVKN